MAHARQWQLASGFRAYAAALLFPLASVWPWAPAHAYETDQWLQRDAVLADARDELNAEVDRALAAIVAERPAPRDERAFVQRVYRRLGGPLWVDRIERHAMASPAIERTVVDAHTSSYAGMPFWMTRVTAFSGVSPTIRVGAARLGTDKLGHFISQGRKFWLRWRRHHDEARAARGGVATERGIFGRVASGVYSNADLVANYEGFRFYRSLFDDGIVAGKPAIVRRTARGWALQRDFDFADHVNAYWDEALNPSAYAPALQRRLEARLSALCGAVRASPAAWAIPADEDALHAQRYAHLGLRPNPALRLTALCAAPPPPLIAGGGAALPAHALRQDR